MLECSFGFRPRRSTHDALQVLIDEAWDGRRWVAESDVSDCFGAIPHDRLMSAIEERIVDRYVLKLLRAMLRAGVMQDGTVTRSVAGTAQGGVISPCLCNVYLHRLDRQWADRGQGVLVRYADDLLALCRTRAEAEAALIALRRILAELGLELKDAKTRIVHLEEGGQGVDFLGFHHRWVRARGARHVCFLARWPSPRAMRHARDRIRDVTDRRWLLRPVDETVREVNAFLRGWSGYFRYGNSARHFDAISNYAAHRVALHVAKRHKRARGYGWSVLAFQSPDRLGLIDLNGTIVAPRPHRAWRGK
ncbi:MAG: reverse transcriptase domain-containing protein [Pseudonocardiaceae bacterium]